MCPSTHPCVIYQKCLLICPESSGGIQPVAAAARGSAHPSRHQHTLFLMLCRDLTFANSSKGKWIPALPERPLNIHPLPTKIAQYGYITAWFWYSSISSYLFCLNSIPPFSQWIWPLYISLDHTHTYTHTERKREAIWLPSMLLLLPRVTVNFSDRSYRMESYKSQELFNCIACHLLVVVVSLTTYCFMVDNVLSPWMS